MAFNSMARNFGSNVGTGSGVYGNIAEFLCFQNTNCSSLNPDIEIIERPCE